VFFFWSVASEDAKPLRVSVGYRTLKGNNQTGRPVEEIRELLNVNPIGM